MARQMVLVSAVNDAMRDWHAEPTNPTLMYRLVYGLRIPLLIGRALIQPDSQPYGPGPMIASDELSEIELMTTDGELIGTMINLLDLSDHVVDTPPGFLDGREDLMDDFADEAYRMAENLRYDERYRDEFRKRWCMDLIGVEEEMRRQATDPKTVLLIELANKMKDMGIDPEDW